MEKDLGNYRRNYIKKELSLKEVPENPMELLMDNNVKRALEL